MKWKNIFNFLVKMMEQFLLAKDNRDARRTP